MTTHTTFNLSLRLVSFANNMKTLIVLVFALVVASAYAEPSAPSAEQMTVWAAFPKPVHLNRERNDRWDFTKGEPIWIYFYSAGKETGLIYMVGLYKSGTLFGRNRGALEKQITTANEEMNVQAKLHPANEINEMLQTLHVEIQSDGRKVYFFIIGGAPGSSGHGGFTTIGQYDLQLVEFDNSDDATAKDEQLKNRSKPMKALPEVFKQLEEFISKEN
jgi:hypothetical protein